MPDREKVVKALECLKAGSYCECCDYKPYDDCIKRVATDAIALLKEQEEQKRKWLMNIADNQLANSPMGNEDEGQLRYKSGLWNGLQIAYDIIAEGR